MKMIFQVFILLFFALPASGSQNEETYMLSNDEEKMVFETANEISDCSGKMYAVSELLNLMDKGNASGHFNELGNGWYIVAAYTAYSLGAIPEWKNALIFSEERAKSVKKQILGRFELTPDTELESEIKKLTDEIQFCNEKWGEYQIKQTEEIRQKMYKAEKVEKK